MDSKALGLAFLSGLLGSWICHLISSLFLSRKISAFFSPTGKSRVSEVYTVHQQRRTETGEWEICSPSTSEPDESLAFVVYVRCRSPERLLPADVLVRVQDDKLKALLRECIPNIDTVLDVNPLV